MTYTVYWSPSQARNLTMEDCKKSNTLNAGMLEQVLDDLISWHDVPAKDVGRVLTYIGYEFGHILVSIELDNYHGSFCEGKLVCATVA